MIARLVKETAIAVVTLMGTQIHGWGNARWVPAKCSRAVSEKAEPVPSHQRQNKNKYMQNLYRSARRNFIDNSLKKKHVLPRKQTSQWTFPARTIAHIKSCKLVMHSAARLALVYPMVNAAPALCMLPFTEHSRKG